MPHVFEYLEIVGVSSVSVEDAVEQAIAAAGKSKSIAWFEIASVRGRILENGKPEYQVTVKCGCKP